MSDLHKAITCLEQAKARLRQGWCRNQYAANVFGGYATPSSSDACRWCLVGSVLRAGDDVSMSAERVSEVIDELCNDLPFNYVSLSLFNDEQDSVEPVVAVVDKTINRLRRRLCS